jgi:hypothetical protein
MRQFNKKFILGDWVVGTTAAGTTAATATTLTADNVWVDVVTASANGVILKAFSAGETKSVVNADSADNLFIYPPSGASFNGATADLPVMIPAGRSAWFMSLTPTKIAAFF